MNAEHPFVVLPREAARRIEDADTNVGELDLHYLPSEDMYVVRRVAKNNVGLKIALPSYQTLNWDGKVFAGQWMKTPASGINESHLDTLRRGADVYAPYPEFKKLLPSLSDPGTRTGLLVTYDPDVPAEWLALGAQRFAAWLVSRDSVKPVPLAVEPVAFGLGQLDGRWPVADLQRANIAVIGVGSIGGPRCRHSPSTASATWSSSTLIGSFGTTWFATFSAPTPSGATRSTR